MKNKFPFYFVKLIVFFLLLLNFTLSLNATNKKLKSECENKDSIIVEIQKTLSNDFALWYPLCIDTVYGGFFSDINYKWQLDGQQNKMIVSQARHLWSASVASMFCKDKDKYLKIAEHGFEFLKNVMWDKQYGGFYDLVKRNGNVITENDQVIKRAYGNSFAIYGLAAYYKASRNKEAIDLAIQTFKWLEKYSYDPENKGYYQFLNQKGEPLKNGFMHYPPKDQNSSIHLLECFTELYKVWPDSLLRERLISLQHLIRDVITTDKGYMNLFFNKDWMAISYRDSSVETRAANYELDHVSFGHNIETAYLLLEVNKVLEIANDSITEKKAKQMVDHTIKYGWDNQFGGIFDRGYYFKDEPDLKIIQMTKEWWAQSETLNSLLLMSTKYPDQKEYYEKFCEQWNYIKNYLLDHTYGGWFWGGIDQVPENKFANKGSIWKVNYHTVRTSINCLKTLRNMNEF